MKLKGKALILGNGAIFIVLSVAVFYISFNVEQNSLARSLIGLLVVLFIGVVATILERRIDAKKYGLLAQTLVTLVLVNASISIILILVFSKGIADFLIFSIPYTLVYSLLTYVRYKLKSE